MATAAGCPLAESDLHAILRPCRAKYGWGRPQSFATPCNRAVRTCTGAVLDLPDLASLEPAFIHLDDLAAVETVRQTAIADQGHRTREARLSARTAGGGIGLTICVLSSEAKVAAWVATVTDNNDLRQDLVQARRTRLPYRWPDIGR